MIKRKDIDGILDIPIALGQELSANDPQTWKSITYKPSNRVYTVEICYQSVRNKTTHDSQMEAITEYNRHIIV